MKLKYELVDITAPEHGVEIDVSQDGRVVWVNVDGQCVLRICRIPTITINTPDITKPGNIARYSCRRCGWEAIYDQSQIPNLEHECLAPGA
jgi:hypothetical protein